MFASLGRAIASFFDGTLRGVALRSIGLTLLLFVLLFVGIEVGLQYMPTLGANWINVTLEVLAPILLVIALFVLGAPVAAIFASLYLDRIARAIESNTYPGDAATAPVSLSTSLSAGVRLAGLVLLVNALLLPVDVELPGIAEVLTILANGWLLGREYFEMAALRHLSGSAAASLRRRHGGAVFVGGTLISLMAAVPALDLLAPLFGAALMVHMFQRFAHEERRT